jgi:hypothetical protein
VSIGKSIVEAGSLGVHAAAIETQLNESECRSNVIEARGHVKQYKVTNSTMPLVLNCGRSNIIPRRNETNPRTMKLLITKQSLVATLLFHMVTPMSNSESSLTVQCFRCRHFVFENTGRRP